MFDAESDYEEETSSSSNEDELQDGEQLWKASQWPGQSSGQSQSFITEAKNVKKSRLGFPRQCSMQVDFEMFLAASPPMFSPLMLGNFDSDYSPFNRTSSSLYNSSLSSLAANLGELSFKSVPSSALNGRRFPTPRSMAPSSVRTSRSARAFSMTAPPLRSCLVVRPDAPAAEEGPSSSDASEGEISPSVSPSRHKKRVVFADDKGLSLTEVKVMTEPSDCPPRWTAEFLEQVTRGASAEVAAERWELTFPQPASDYLNFRSRLETQNVALENLVVQEGDQQLVGTVKVKNLCFTKQVLVRVSFDQWKSYRDTEATYVASGLPTSSSAPVNLFDTFSFKLAIPAIPPTLNRIELCICFKSDAGEFWDNNQGKNYVLVKPDPPKVKTSPPTLRKSAENRNLSGAPEHRCNDAARVRLDSWTEFASWNHLVTDLPYW